MLERLFVQTPPFYRYCFVHKQDADEVLEIALSQCSRSTTDIGSPSRIPSYLIYFLTAFDLLIVVEVHS